MESSELDRMQAWLEKSDLAEKAELNELRMEDFLDAF